MLFPPFMEFVLLYIIIIIIPVMFISLVVARNTIDERFITWMLKLIIIGAINDPSILHCALESWNTHLSALSQGQLSVVGSSFLNRFLSFRFFFFFILFYRFWFLMTVFRLS